MVTFPLTHLAFYEGKKVRTIWYNTCDKTIIIRLISCSLDPALKTPLTLVVTKIYQNLKHTYPLAAKHIFGLMPALQPVSGTVIPSPWPQSGNGPDGICSPTDTVINACLSLFLSDSLFYVPLFISISLYFWLYLSLCSNTGIASCAPFSSSSTPSPLLLSLFVISCNCMGNKKWLEIPT